MITLPWQLEHSGSLSSFSCAASVSREATLWNFHHAIMMPWFLCLGFGKIVKILVSTVITGFLAGRRSPAIYRASRLSPVLGTFFQDIEKKTVPSGTAIPKNLHLRLAPPWLWFVGFRRVMPPLPMVAICEQSTWLSDGQGGQTHGIHLVQTSYRNIIQRAWRNKGSLWNWERARGCSKTKLKS